MQNKVVNCYRCRRQPTVRHVKSGAYTTEALEGARGAHVRIDCEFCDEWEPSDYWVARTSLGKAATAWNEMQQACGIGRKLNICRRCRTAKHLKAQNPQPYEHVIVCERCMERRKQIPRPDQGRGNTPELAALAWNSQQRERKELYHITLIEGRTVHAEHVSNKESLRDALGTVVYSTYGRLARQTLVCEPENPGPHCKRLLLEFRTAPLGAPRQATTHHVIARVERS